MEFGDSEHRKLTFTARGDFIVLLAQTLKEWAVLDENEQKRLDSIFRALTKYCNYLQDELDSLEEK